MEEINKYLSRNDLKEKNLDESSFLLVEEHNQKFIALKLKEYKDYFDHIYDNIDSNILLDQEQRIAILNDEDYMMIIAGAGSGKTTTIAAKVKYLVDKLGIDEQQILVLSYTNKAVDELKRIINTNFNIKANITTFHKLAYSCLKDDHIELISNSKFIIDKYLMNVINENKEIAKQLVKFYNNYFSISPLFLKMIENNKLKRIIMAYQTKKTIKGEYLSSYQETIIANLLYLNNIPYKYHHKIFTSYFTFNINKQEYYIFVLKNNSAYNNVVVNFFNDDQAYKIIMHSDIEDNYEEIIKELKKSHIIKDGFSLNECYKKIIKVDKNKYESFTSFCDQFLKLTKNIDKDIWKINKEYDDRTNMFLKIINEIDVYYQSYLKENNCLDFDDLIIKAEQNMTDNPIKYKYVIVDEYQDISVTRFSFIKKIVEMNNSKLIVIGDDWQTIFSFAGSQLNLFLEFKEQMSYATELKITNTYRNSQELINIAGEFIMRNNKQIKKRLLSGKKKDYPVKILIYNNINDALEEAIDHIISHYGINKNILLLGRYQFDFNNIISNKNFHKINEEQLLYKKSNQLLLYYLTIHKSKGLGFDNVIIVNGNNGIYGFPSLIKNDPIMKIINKDIDEQNKEEERRLFYVALTRSKNDVYILCQKHTISPFVEEIQEYSNVETKIINKYSKYL